MQRARVSLSIDFHRPEGPQNSSLPNSERGPGSQGPGQEAAAVAGPKERGGEAESGESEPRYQHCPSSPLPLFERITSCYCVDSEGQELGREAGLGPTSGERKEEPEEMSWWPWVAQLPSPAPGGLDRE